MPSSSFVMRRPELSVGRVETPSSMYFIRVLFLNPSMSLTFLAGRSHVIN
jgi:hypothetical protein